MVNPQLESDLKEAFSLHASGIPSEAAARVRGIDYRPRTSRVSPRMTVGALAGAAATTGAVVSVIVLGSAQAAFAGWSPSPTLVSAGQTSSADTACHAQLAADRGLPGATSQTGATSPSEWSAVATDVRGPFTLVIYQDGNAHASCLTGPSIMVLSQSSGSGGSMTVSGTVRKGTGGGNSTSTMIGSVTSGSIEQLSVDHLASTTQGAYTIVTGQVEAGVTGVTLVRGDGEDVQASVSNGALVAWWPGTQDVTSAQITTAVGVTTQTLKTLPLLPPPGHGSCNLSPQTTETSVVCTGGAVGRGSGGPSVNVGG